ncbi:MAG: DUF3467 domain-containing protein [Planctomycetes bacterium]|nr:DUF3467 domain-containing protein [Planctomycetota bacterium]
MADQPKMEPQPVPQQAQAFPLDYTTLSTVYTNFCHMSVTPEELILDFGLNPTFSPTPSATPIKMTHRVVMNFFTAKRLLGFLHRIIEQHEVNYGVLELDINKRVRTMPRPPAVGGAK